MGKSPKAGKDTMTSARKSVGGPSFSCPDEFSIHSGQLCLDERRKNLVDERSINILPQAR